MKQKKIKAWAVMGKISGKVYFVVPTRKRAVEIKKEEKPRMTKVVPCLISFPQSPKKNKKR